MKKLIRITIIIGLICYIIAFFVYCYAMAVPETRDVLSDSGFKFLVTGFFIWFIDVILIMFEKLKK